MQHPQNYNTHRAGKEFSPNRFVRSPRHNIFVCSSGTDTINAHHYCPTSPSTPSVFPVTSPLLTYTYICVHVYYIYIYRHNPVIGLRQTNRHIDICILSRGRSTTGPDILFSDSLRDVPLKIRLVHGGGRNLHY